MCSVFWEEKIGSYLRIEPGQIRFKACVMKCTHSTLVRFASKSFCTVFEKSRALVENDEIWEIVSEIQL